MTDLNRIYLVCHVLHEAKRTDWGGEFDAASFHIKDKNPITLNVFTDGSGTANEFVFKLKPGDKIIVDGSLAPFKWNGPCTTPVNSIKARHIDLLHRPGKDGHLA